MHEGEEIIDKKVEEISTEDDKEDDKVRGGEKAKDIEDMIIMNRKCLAGAHPFVQHLLHRLLMRYLR